MNNKPQKIDIKQKIWHFLIDYDFPGPYNKKSEPEMKRKQFYKELKKILPGKLLNYSATDSVINVNTIEKAKAIYNLAIECGASRVRIQIAATLRSFDEGKEETYEVPVTIPLSPDNLRVFKESTTIG